MAAYFGKIPWVLLICIVGEETKALIMELHKGVCGRHHAW